MIRALALLFSIQLSGEIIVRALGLPVPGPVLGFALLALGLIGARHVGGPASADIETTDLGRTAMGLLGVLGILFVPAGVGLIQQLPLIRAHGLGLVAALVGSTVLTLVVTVWVFVAVARLAGRRQEP